MLLFVNNNLGVLFLKRAVAAAVSTATQDVGAGMPFEPPYRDREEILHRLRRDDEEVIMALVAILLSGVLD